MTTKRGLRALKYGVNMCQSSFDSPSYCRRLEKYAWRGFLVAVPGFEAHKLSHAILESNYTYHEKHDVPAAGARPPHTNTSGAHWCD